jgi:hypothetical protein
MTAIGRQSLISIIEQKEFFAQLSDFDKHMEFTRNRLPARSDTLNESQRIALLLFDFMRDHFFMMRVIGLKLAEIGLGYNQAKKVENASVQITLSRAFLEHAASLAYQAAKLEAKVADFPKQPDISSIELKIKSALTELSTLYYASSRSKDNRDYVNVNSMIKYLAKKVKDIQQRYDELCDFVHPNYKSNLLVSEGKLGAGKLGLPYAQLEKELLFADDTVDTCSNAVLEIQKEMSRNLALVDSYIKISMLPDTKPSQIFSTKAAYSGDGKSPETAICFEKARTLMENHAALAEYFKKNKITPMMRQPGWVESGCVLEAYQTNKGFIWFKFRITDEFER